jgi:PAS domain S-box-containing protein
VLRIADVLEDPRYGKNPPFEDWPEGRPPVRSYLAAPVISREGKVLGGLYFGHDRPNAFSERIEPVVSGIAAQAAIALDNARLYRELSDSEARFRQLADAMPQIVWSAAPDGTIDYFNRRWYEFTGLSEGTRDDARWPTVLHPDDVQQSVTAWQEAVRSGDVYENEGRYQDRRSGEYRWHLVRALPMRNSSGRVMRWFGTSTDIHELKQAQAAIMEASRRKDEFLAMLGHELRNPLAAVANAMSLLWLDDINAEEALQAREIMERQVQNMTRLIEDHAAPRSRRPGRTCRARRRGGSPARRTAAPATRSRAPRRAHPPRCGSHEARTDSQQPAEQRNEIHGTGRQYPAQRRAQGQ